MSATSTRIWVLLLLLYTFLGFNQAALAQEISIENVIISIPEGIFFNTGGGIDLESEGAIANNGHLEIEGDWINNGKGLLESSKGEVVLKGGNQVIGGCNRSNFCHLTLEGKGAKELKADISVSGILDLQSCALLTHEYDLELSEQTMAKIIWSNGLIIKAKVSQVNYSATFSATFPFENTSHCWTIVPAAVSAAPTTSFRSKPQARSGQQLVGGFIQAANAVSSNARTIESSIVDKGVPIHGAHAAISTMYFSSQVKQDSEGDVSMGNVLAFGDAQPTDNDNSPQRGSWNSNSASAFSICNTCRFDAAYI